MRLELRGRRRERSEVLPTVRGPPRGGKAGLAFVASSPLLNGLLLPGHTNRPSAGPHCLRREVDSESALHNWSSTCLTAVAWVNKLQLHQCDGFESERQDIKPACMRDTPQGIVIQLDHDSVSMP